MVRNAMFRRVDLASRDAFAELARVEAANAALPEPPRQPLMDEAAWDEALAGYWEDHDAIGTDGAARGPALFAVEVAKGPAPGAAAPDEGLGEGPDDEHRLWLVRQTLDDPDGDHDWVLEATVDLDASDEAGEPVVLATALRRL
jgi:hypothetical protein